MNKPLRVLIVEDSEDDAELVTREIQHGGYDPTIERVDTAEAMNAALHRAEWDIVISDYVMPQFDGLAAYKVLQEHGRDIPFIIVSGAIGEETAVDAMKSGVDDYVLKDNLIRLVPAVERELRDAEVRRQRRQTEEALKESEWRNAVILETAIDGIISINEKGIVQSLNSAVERIFGYSFYEVVGKNIMMLMPPLLRKQHSAGLKKYLRTGQSNIIGKSVVLSGQRKNGEIFPLEITVGEAQRDERILFTATLRDITKRKQAEEKLRENQRLLEAEISVRVQKEKELRMLHKITVASNESRSSGEAFQIAIDEVCRFMDWPVGHVYELPAGTEDVLYPSKIWHLADNDRFRKFVSITGKTKFSKGIGLPGRVLETGEPAWIFDISEDQNFPRAKLTANLGVKAGFAFPVLIAKRTVAVLEFFSETVAEPDEAVLEVMAQIGTQLGQVIEREVAKEELSASQRLLQTVFDTLTIPVFVIDRESRFLMVNRAIGYGLRLKPESFIKKTIAQMKIGTEDEIKRIYAENQHIFETGETIDLPDVPFTINGKLRSHRLIRAPLYDDQRKIVGIVGIREDITDRKRLEEQLKASQRMESIGTLAGGIAHDFNNILSVIGSYSGFVLDQLQEGDTAYEDVRVIQESTDRGASLTRQLLAFSRRQVMRLETTDLNRIVQDMEKMLRRLIGEDIFLFSNLEDDLGQVTADVSQIEQIVMNFAVNARDAMPKGGKLTIETANVNLDEGYAEQHVAVEPGAYVMLAVSDTGTGMDDETRSKIFEPFFTTKEVGKGTGLGLSTVYGIVKQMNGYIWVYSEPGHGTTFKIYLPRIEEEELQKDPHSPTSEKLEGTETVLLVEDEERVREAARRILKMHGYRVLEASHGAEALGICKQHKDQIQLMLTDVIMPGMSGGELAEQVALIFPQIRILYMSGYTDEAIAHHGVLQEGITLLQKPFSQESLLRLVREVLETSDKQE